MGGRHARPPSAGARTAAAFVATSLLGLVGFVAANAVFDSHSSPQPADTSTESMTRTTSGTSGDGSSSDGSSSDGSSTSAGSSTTTATQRTAAVATTGPAGVTPAPRATTAPSRAPGTTAPLPSSSSSTKRPHPTHPTKPTKPGPLPTTPPTLDLVQELQLVLRTVGP